ncbi:MAG: putative Ig domain-containing protein [Chitinophagaceae bacterium]
MKTIFLPVLVICTLMVPAVSMGQIDYKGFPEWSLQKRDSTEYALYTPSKLQAGRKYPVVLFMHGCCGTDNHASLRNAVDPPVRMWHQFGANKQTVPTYIIAPATARGWKQHFVTLKAIIDNLIAHHQGDPQRIYVTGFSMGGEGVFSIIQRYPGFFAAAIPMGMNFSGDSLKVKGVPIWANQGETDFHARNLRKQVAAIRTLNAGIQDTGSTWVTGVYPRYTNFKGIGHAVQWIAASTQDLTGWAYGEINDGNKKPSVFFTPVVNPIPAIAGKSVPLTIDANDPGGSVSKMEVYVNHRLIKTLFSKPYVVSVMPIKGDNLIEAIAYDNKSRHSFAVTILRVKISPRLVPMALPVAYAGAYYRTSIKARGNGTINYSVMDGSKLPMGMLLYPDGSLKGIPVEKGIYKIAIKAVDLDNESAIDSYTIVVKDKRTGDVLVREAATDSAYYRLSKISIGEAPFFDSKDSVLNCNPEEINFSDVGQHAGLTFIQTNVNDANKTADKFLHFKVDADVVVYIAYEKMDKLLVSTIPAWLQTYKKEQGQVVAQYRYFDVYSKLFKKGAVVLPGADAAHNGVANNYFVMIKKQ